MRTSETLALTRRLALAGLVFSPVAVADAAGPLVTLYATGSGKLTLDGENDGGGNPFATALIEVMSRADLTFADACALLLSRTSELSQGFMQAEAVGLPAAPPWRLAKAPGERRTALVVIFSDYAASDAAKSLPGAAIDGARVAAAFRAAGFDTRLLANATRPTLAAELRQYSTTSAVSDIAALPCTGHGVEHDGVQYVLFGDHVVADGAAGLVRAARWKDMETSCRARKLNLAFWAGCRNDPFA